MNDELFQLTPRWVVITSPHNREHHGLFYAGKGYDTATGESGLNRLRDAAELFNRHKKTPVERARAQGAEAVPAELFFETETNKPTIEMSKNESNAPAAPTVQMEPASRFTRYPYNREISPERIKEMKSSILDVGGVIEPLLARPLLFKEEPVIKVNDRTCGAGFLEIISGETRWLGCCAIGMDYLVPVIVREISDKEAAKLHAVANFQRTDLNDIEAAQAIAHMKETGWTIEEICESLGRQKDYIYQRLAILKLPESVQEAVKEKNVSLRTAEVISRIPEERREEALKAVTQPRHSASALPEREAMALLNRDFVEPAKKAEEWDARRKLLEKENPDCEWLSYEKAMKIGGYEDDFEAVLKKPGYAHLSDAAREGELVVPTWGELAGKHGAKKFLGLATDGETATIFVGTTALIEAEKAAHDEKPGDCIFTHDLAVHQAKLDAEKRREEVKARQAGLVAETIKAIDVMMGRGKKLAAAAELKLALAIYKQARVSYALEDTRQLAIVLGLEARAEDEDMDEFDAKVDKAAAVYLKGHEVGAFAALGLLHGACLIEQTNDSCSIGECAEMLVGSKAFAKKDFPLLQEEWESEQKRREDLAAKMQPSVEPEEEEEQEDAA